MKSPTRSPNRPAPPAAAPALIALAAAIIPTAGVAQDVTVTTSARVKLRSAPAAADHVLRILERGETVRLVDETGQAGFFRVRASDRTEGWAHGDYLLVSPDEEEGAPEIETTAVHANRPLCGGKRHYRWAAKTTTAGFGGAAHPASVPVVLGWSPLPFKGTSLTSWCRPRDTREDVVTTVSGWVRRVKNESDGDVHIEVTSAATDDPTRCIVVEIPPADLSPQFQAARSELATLLSVATIANTDPDPPIHAEFEGLAFWDGWHEVGALPVGHGRCNSTPGAAWELHPVFKVSTP
jgi:uncharacterized protein YgiM (DUF1202 family)